jgi:predicted neuraminidase
MRVSRSTPARWALPALVLLPSMAVAQPPGLVAEEFIFEVAPFRSCHASTVAQAGDGLVAAWFGGSRESESDVSIWLARRGEGGWSKPELVADGRQPGGQRHATWNPVLFQPRGGRLVLFYKVGPDETEWWGELKTSDDGGRTWSAARRLPQGILGPIKNKPVQLADGVILSGSSVEAFVDPKTREDEIWQVHIERSTDGGESWTKIGPLKDGSRFNAIQPSILTWPGRRLQLLCRSERAGRILEAWSEDAGLTWGPLAATQLPNPDAGTDALTLADGRALLVYNHTMKGRRVLNVAVSADGRGWQAALVLENQPGEYSYPAVIQTADGLVHVTYTWRRERIKHVVLDPARFELRPIRDGAWPGAKATEAR